VKIGPWQVEVLIVHEPGYVRAVISAGFNEDNWDEFGVNGKYFASFLELEDNFAVFAAADNEEIVDFHLLVCTKKIFTCTEAFRCKWGESFEVGNQVIQGRYYQKYGTAANTSRKTCPLRSTPVRLAVPCDWVVTWGLLRGRFWLCRMTCTRWES
jgi:hypothetical protein